MTTIKEICDSQIQLAMQLCKKSDFANARSVMNNFYAMSLPKDDPDVNRTHIVFGRFENQISKVEQK